MPSAMKAWCLLRRSVLTVGIDMNLKKGIPVVFGPLRGFVYGGRFKEYVPGTRRLIGVKMAAEINHPHEVSIPTEDFSTPSTEDMQNGMISAVDALLNGNDIYVGCMGGIGRTGLFMGCMAKLMQDYASEVEGAVEVPGFTEDTDPVKYVRKHYIPYAIETSEQQDFVRNFDTGPVLRYLNNATAPVEVVRRVEVTKYPTLIEYMAWWATGGFLK